jgi:glycerol-3-phosphate dehydrogenase
MSERSLDKLAESPLDVLVVGGGIVGAGIARDAAMRGLKTGLVDQHDFASGTSSRSSRLLHGGIRYLAQGRVGLVWEASREKRVIGHIAPHLAESLAFIFPTRKGTSWTKWKMAAGVKLYDLLCGMRNYGPSRVMSLAATRSALPNLATTSLTGAVRYFDALTNDARLVIDTLRSAAAAGATACNYVRLVDAQQNKGFWDCELVDDSTDRVLNVRSRTVVNATGPWSDRLPNSKTSLRLTKGVHLVIDRSRLDVPDALVMADGERILFAIPWGERVILGTTDTDYNGPLDNPPCDAADVQYVLDVVNETFPSLQITDADVISAWSGLRPLVADPNGNPSDISRRHEVSMNSPGWWDVTGGKLTTYRLMAEETVDGIVKYSGAKATPCQTASQPLVRAEEVQQVSGILPPEVSAQVVQHYCRHEWARHLDDVMIRRTSWRHYHRDQMEIASHVARWMASELDWSGEQIERELVRYRQLVGAGISTVPHAPFRTAPTRRAKPGDATHPKRVGETAN